MKCPICHKDMMFNEPKGVWYCTSHPDWMVEVRLYVAKGSYPWKEDKA